MKGSGIEYFTANKCVNVTVVALGFLDWNSYYMHYTWGLSWELIKILHTKRSLKEAYLDFAEKRAWKKNIKILLKRSLKEGNEDKKEESEENKRNF